MAKADWAIGQFVIYQARSDKAMPFPYPKIVALEEGGTPSPSLGCNHPPINCRETARAVS